MATTSTSTSTAVTAVKPVFTEPERLALAGFLAGYTGLTREAYALDLRQYASWCQRHHLPLLLEDHPATPANRKPRGCGGTRRSPGPVYPGGTWIASRGCQRGRVPFRRCPDDRMHPSFGEEHGQIPRRGQRPVAGLAAELASCPHGIRGRPAPDSRAVVPDVHADRHAVRIGQLQRLGGDLCALGRVALLVHQLQIPPAMRPAVNPRDDVIDRGAARRVRQVIPAPRAAPGLRLHEFGHECQAVRCPRHHLAVILAITSPGAKRPAAEPLPGRHRQPAHTAPASLRRHQVKLTGGSDIPAQSPAVSRGAEEDLAAA